MYKYFYYLNYSWIELLNGKCHYSYSLSSFIMIQVFFVEAVTSNVLLFIQEDYPSRGVIFIIYSFVFWIGDFFYLTYKKEYINIESKYKGKLNGSKLWSAISVYIVVILSIVFLNVNLGVNTP